MFKAILRSLELKIVDFDDAIIYSGTNHRFPIGTNRYRAPEVTLGTVILVLIGSTVLKHVLPGMEWGPPVDVFSVGCVLAELVTGRPLFTASFDEVERVAAIEVVVGLFPSRLVDQSRSIDKNIFTKGLSPRAKFPPRYLCDDCAATSEAVARVASLTHFSVSR